MGAFYAMLPSRIDASIRLWTKELPTVKPFYAVKCNPEPKFLNYLFDRGINFDCASERELLEIRDLARTRVADRIIYANPCKSGRDLQAAESVGSPLTVVDSVEEVEKLADLSYKGTALIRVAVDDTGSDMPFSSKFGALGKDIKTIAEAAYSLSIGIRGFSFHIGSSSKDYKAYSKAIEYCSGFSVTLLNQGHAPEIIDIGGGFLPAYAEDDFKLKASSIRETISKTYPSIKFIAEPGRFLAGNSFDFFVEVIGKKFVGGEWKYTIDDSIYGQFSSILFDHAKPVWTRVRSERDVCRPYTKGTLFGRTCDSLDVIAKSDSMEELDVGDWLRFPRMGAYTRATASEFNGFPRPNVFILDEKQCLEYEHSAHIGQECFPLNVRHPSAVSVKDIL